VDFSTKKFLRNPVTLLAAFFLLGWFGVQLWGVAQKAYALYGERKRLEAELASLQQKKSQLEEGLSRFQSEAYLEREAKSRLNLKKPGEQIVIIVPEEKQREAVITPPSFWSRFGTPLFFWKK
jgi:cell division protein FtsB